MIYQWLKDGCKKANQGIADNADGYIRCFYAGIEQYPVKTEQRTRSRELGEFFERYFWYACEYKQKYSGEEHAVPCDINLVERYKLTEKSSEAAKQDGEMKADECCPVSFCSTFSFIDCFRMKHRLQIFLICHPFITVIKVDDAAISETVPLKAMAHYLVVLVGVDADIVCLGEAPVKNIIEDTATTGQSVLQPCVSHSKDCR